MAEQIVENLLRTMQGARDLMEAARSASDDYASCERQLIRLRLRAESLGGGTSGASVSGSGHDSLERRVVALADRERDIEARMQLDEAVMDAACLVLYGTDEDGGLAALVPSFWCDALWWHYLQGESWVRVGRILGYSPDHLKDVTRQALQVADERRVMASVLG